MLKQSRNQKESELSEESIRQIVQPSCGTKLLISESASVGFDWAVRSLYL